MFLYSETLSKDIETIFRHIFLFNTTCFGSCPVHICVIQWKQRKGRVISQNGHVLKATPAAPILLASQAKQAMVGTTPVVIDVHPNGYTNATNRAVSLDLHWCLIGTRICCDSHCVWGPEDIGNSKKFSIWEKVYDQTKGASFALSLEVPCHKHFLALPPLSLRCWWRVSSRRP